MKKINIKHVLGIEIILMVLHMISEVIVGGSCEIISIAWFGVIVVTFSIAVAKFEIHRQTPEIVGLLLLSSIFVVAVHVEELFKDVWIPFLQKSLAEDVIPMVIIMITLIVNSIIFLIWYRKRIVVNSTWKQDELIKLFSDERYDKYYGEILWKLTKPGATEDAFATLLECYPYNPDMTIQYMNSYGRKSIKDIDFFEKNLESKQETAAYRIHQLLNHITAGGLQKGNYKKDTLSAYHGLLHTITYDNIDRWKDLVPLFKKYISMEDGNGAVSRLCIQLSDHHGNAYYKELHKAVYMYKMRPGLSYDTVNNDVAEGDLISFYKQTSQTMWKALDPYIIRDILTNFQFPVTRINKGHYKFTSMELELLGRIFHDLYAFHTNLEEETKSSALVSLEQTVGKIEKLFKRIQKEKCNKWELISTSFFKDLDSMYFIFER